LANETIKPVQKSETLSNPLIQLKWLLGLLIILLAAEWLIRKYLGDV